MFFKKTLPLIVAFVFGWIAVLTDYIPHSYSEALLTAVTKGIVILYAVVAFLGVYSLLSMHYTKIKRRVPGFGYSIFAWLGFLIMFIAGVYNDGNWMFKTQAETGPVQWLYLYVFAACQAAMFSTLAFFIASAAYRTFRAKTLEAFLLLTAAVLVMFGKVPISNLVWDGFPAIAQWLLDYPNLAVKRAIYFGIALGAVSTSLRIMFGIERSYLGGDN